MRKAVEKMNGKSRMNKRREHQGYVDSREPFGLMDIVSLVLAAVLVTGCVHARQPKWTQAGHTTATVNRHDVSRFAFRSAPTLSMIGDRAGGTKGPISGSGSSLCWSWNGKWLAFSHRDKRNTWAVSVTDTSRVLHIAEGLPNEPRPTMGQNRELAFTYGSRDAKFAYITHIRDVLAPHKQSRITLPNAMIAAIRLSPNDGTIALVTRTPKASKFSLVFSDPRGVISKPARISFWLEDAGWSPKGDRLAVLRHTMFDETDCPKQHLYLYFPHTRQLKPIVTHRLVHRWVWSRDGRHIYYTERKWQPVVPIRLWRVSVTTGKEEVLADLASLGSNLELVVPSPDGKAALAVVKKTDKARDLELLDFEKKTRWLVASGDLWSPTWSPSGDRFAVSVGGNLWVVNKADLSAYHVTP